MKITTIWVVYDPSPVSELSDILYETDVIGLARLVMGTGLDTWKHENTTLYTEKMEARRDANQRMTRRGNKEASMGTEQIVARYLKIVEAANEVAMEFNTPRQLQEYLRDHPGADKSKHHVVKDDASSYRHVNETEDAGYEDLEPDNDSPASEKDLEEEAKYSGPRYHQHVVVAQRFKQTSDQVAMEFDTPEAMAKYLKDHPGADKAKHSVKKHKEEGASKNTSHFNVPGLKNNALEKVKTGEASSEDLEKAIRAVAEHRSELEKASEKDLSTGGSNHELKRCEDVLQRLQKKQSEVLQAEHTTNEEARSKKYDEDANAKFRKMVEDDDKKMLDKMPPQERKREEAWRKLSPSAQERAVRMKLWPAPSGR